MQGQPLGGPRGSSKFGRPNLSLSVQLLEDGAVRVWVHVADAARCFPRRARANSQSIHFTPPVAKHISADGEPSWPVAIHRAAKFPLFYPAY